MVRHSIRPSIRRAIAPLAAAVVAGVLVVGSATPASAHVHVEADTTAAGADSELTFTVPDESESARTVEVSVTLPQDHPFLELSAEAISGWTITTTEAKLPKPVVVEGTTLTRAVRTVTWTANQGEGIGPGLYQRFGLSVGPLPSAGTLAIPATQTYSDGTVVRWDQPTPASGDEPEHPAPTLTVTAADSASGSGGHPASTGTGTTTASDPLGRALGGTGLGLGVIGAVLGAVALIRTRGLRAGR